MMDPVTIQLPPVMPDTFYDHNAGYHAYSGSTTSLWPNRDESMRAYLAQGPEFESHIRHTGFLPRRTGVSNVVTGNKESAETEQNDWTGTEGKGSDEVKEHGPYKQSQVAETLSCFCKQSSHLTSSFLRERVKRRSRDYRLSENYERAEGVCLPRCVLYQHYLDFCKKTKFTPAGAATFGKIIRQRFPKLTTRRLGTRGQSKYHYYGIGIKESSIYYHSVYSGKGLTRFSGIKIKTEGSNRKYSLSSKTGTLLPEFPNADNLILPSEDQRDKMGTFIMMYRTHCQRILDTVISANFDEVQNFLVHFWQGMPDHLVDILELDIVVDIIGLCDSILYKVLVDVLIPSTIQDLPDSLYSEMKLLAKRIPFWLETSMENIHKPIREKKMEVAKTFIHSLTRQASFVSLAQTARSVLTSHDSVNQMIEDLAEVDFLEVCTQAGFMESSSTPKFSEKLFIYYEEFQALLAKQAPIETYTEWLDDIIDKCVLQSSKTNNVFKEKAAEFLLQWEAFGALLLRDLTLRSAASFGSFHLVHILLDEYAFLVFETQEEQEREKELQKKVQQHMKNSEEIQTQPKLRNCSSKLQQSPKFRKRKHEEDAENDTTNDQDGPSAIRSNNYAPDICPMTNTTAFTRPTPATREAQQPLISGLDATTHVNQTNIPMSSLRSYQGYNSGSYDRPTYLPQFGINYSDYSNPSLGGRLPTYSDSFSQTFPSNPFSALSPSNSAYWPESRGHHTYTDPYHGYNYNKLSAQYENLNKSTILRNNVYQESLNRQAALDTTMPYYRTTHDNLQVCTPLTVGPYTGNFMDIAPTGSQYCRQDNLHYQDDLYTMATTLGKSYLTTPFR